MIGSLLLGNRLSLVLADHSHLGQLALAVSGTRHKRHEDAVEEEHNCRGDGQPVRPAVRQCRQLANVEVGAEHRHRHHNQRTCTTTTSH